MDANTHTHKHIYTYECTYIVILRGTSTNSFLKFLVQPEMAKVLQLSEENQRGVLAYTRAGSQGPRSLFNYLGSDTNRSRRGSGKSLPSQAGPSGKWTQRRVSIPDSPLVVRLPEGKTGEGLVFSSSPAEGILSCLVGEPWTRVAKVDCYLRVQKPAA